MTKNGKPKSDKVYGGIDISLSSTAMVSVSSNGSVLNYVSNLGYSIQDNFPLSEYLIRSEIIKSGVVSFVSSCDIVFIEGYSYGSKGKSIIQIAELVGYIKHCLVDKCVNSKTDVVFIPPTSLKKFATGSGHAKKIDMIISSLKEGFETNDDNLADAFHLARMAMFSDNIEKLGVSQKQTLKKAIKIAQRIGMKNGN